MSADIAPAWFGPAMAASMADILPPILAPILAPIKQSQAKSTNYQNYDGSDHPFEILPFNDGSLPNMPPVSSSQQLYLLFKLIFDSITCQHS
jgi:hypothetical protein